MSKAIGIVAEYNPFHNGHAHHLREAKRIAGNRPVIAAMSGSLVQRGLPALTDKWTRARMAVLGGVDLVLELPTVFTCRSAEFFAAGAVKLLAATGMVSHLAFGAEAANSQQLMLTAEFLNEPVFQDALHHYLDEGHSYAKSLELTLAEDPSMLTIAEHPNNILALEYCRQLLHGGYEIEPVVVKRRGSGYKDKTINGPIAGATAIREHYRGYGIDEALLSTVPATTAQLLREADLQHRMDISDKILNHLLFIQAAFFDTGPNSRSLPMQRRIGKPSGRSCFLHYIPRRSQRHSYQTLSRFTCQKTADAAFTAAVSRYVR